MGKIKYPRYYFATLFFTFKITLSNKHTYPHFYQQNTSTLTMGVSCSLPQLEQSSGTAGAELVIDCPSVQDTLNVLSCLRTLANTSFFAHSLANPYFRGLQNVLMWFVFWGLHRMIHWDVGEKYYSFRCCVSNFGDADWTPCKLPLLPNDVSPHLGLPGRGWAQSITFLKGRGVCQSPESSCGNFSH